MTIFNFILPEGKIRISSETRVVICTILFTSVLNEQVALDSSCYSTSHKYVSSESVQKPIPLTRILGFHLADVHSKVSRIGMEILDST